ncbi:hypothetical protein BDC45DRAFT_601966 [Circinella umbellata]|nr:hypothetical protein BDC45DRAFT_601966 [Circinella umbellata]
MTRPSYQVRPCESITEVLKTHYKWAIDQQWDSGKDGNDIKQVLYPTQPSSFLVGTIQEEGKENKEEKILASICAIQYDDNNGFLAWYIVGEATERKKGYGLQVFNQALENLSTSSWIGLNGVAEQVHNYKKSGFTVHGDITRYNGKNNNNDLLTTTTEAVNIAESPQLLDQLVDRDHRTIGMRRPTFIGHWVQYHSTYGWGLALKDKENKVVGFGCMRPLESGLYRIGPLFADSLDYAQDLVTRLMAKAPSGSEYTTDAWMTTPETKELFEDRLGWSPLATFHRMWRKGTHINENNDQVPCPYESPAIKNGYYSVVSVEVG